MKCLMYKMYQKHFMYPHLLVKNIHLPQLHHHLHQARLTHRAAYKVSGHQGTQYALHMNVENASLGSQARLGVSAQTLTLKDVRDF